MCVKCSARTKLPLLFSIFLCPSKSCQEPTSPAINTLGAELTLQLQLPYIPPVPQMPLLLVLCVCMSSMMRLPELLIQVLHPPLCLCVCVRRTPWQLLGGSQYSSASSSGSSFSTQDCFFIYRFTKLDTLSTSLIQRCPQFIYNLLRRALYDSNVFGSLVHLAS